MIVNSEKSVRRYMNIQHFGKIFWIEPAPGSSVGLPDCFVLNDGKTTFYELKCGVRRKDGRVKFEVRPEQKLNATKMHANGADLKWVIGIKGTSEMIIMPTTKEILEGCVNWD